MINVRADEETGKLTVEFVGPWQGIDTQSPAMQLRDNHLAACQNMDLPAGAPTRMDGYAIHATSFDTGTSTPNLLARFVPATGNAFYITADESGQVYSHVSAGGAPTIIRRGLSTTTDLYWTHTQLGNYLVIANPTDGNFKWDGTRLLPLGALYVADMESDEVTWTGGTANTTTVREGTQSRSIAAAGGGTDTMSLDTGAVRDFLSGLLEAADYSTTTARLSFQVNLDTAANLTLASSYIRFRSVAGSDVNYFQLAATDWGALANGWNLVRAARSAFTTVGAPVWSSIDEVVFVIDANPATSVTAIFDDMYFMYSAVLTMPAVQYVTNWKNMILGGRETTNISTFHFSRVSAPDEYDGAATFPINLNDGDGITGMHPYYNQVLITKDNSCHSISGTVAGTAYPNYNLETLLVTIDHGGSSHRALVQAGNYIYIWWRGEIHRYNGTGTEKISIQIDPTLATINMARLSQVVGARRRVLNQIKWYYPDGSATANDTGLILDYENAGFMTVAGQSEVMATQVFESGIEYFLSASDNGQINRQDSGADNGGTAITAFMTLPWVSAQNPDELKCWLELYVPYETNTGNLIVEYRLAAHPREFAAASYVTAGTIDQAVTGEYGRAFIGDNSVWIQIRLRTVGARMTIFSPIILKAVPLGAYI